MKNKHVYREVALARLSSPEQLDQLMQITTTRGWIALIAIGFMLVMAIVWGVWGTIPSKVKGSGILLRKGGIFEIAPVGSGQLAEFFIQVGEEIKEGEIIAKIAQPTLVEKIRKAQLNLEEVEAQQREKIKSGSEDIRLQKEYFLKQRNNLKYSIDNANQELEWLTEKVSNQEKLYAQGLITKQTLLSTKQDYFQTIEEIERLQNDLKQIAVKEHNLDSQQQQEIIAGKLKINDLKRSLSQLEAELDLMENVRSPYAGRVLELMMDQGEIASPSKAILRLEASQQDSKELEAILYVDGFDGKRIKPGMEVLISPSNVKPEEYGFILGTISYVADFPSTFEGMMRTLKNRTLVGALSENGNGPPFEVYAELKIDSVTPSGYRWTSSEGPPLKVFGGTPCNAQIIVREQRPMSFVIPLLRKSTGV